MRSVAPLTRRTGRTGIDKQLNVFSCGRECWKQGSSLWDGEAAMIPELETERMWLRPVRLEDADQAQQLFPQWEIVKYLGGGAVAVSARRRAHVL